MAIVFRCLFLILSSCIWLSSLAQISYPKARTEPFDTIIYGQKISDPYFWMSRKPNESEVVEFSKAQTALTKTLLDSIPGTDILYSEWDEGYAAFQDELWSVHTVGETIYYNRDIPGEGVWLCRRKSAQAPEEKLLGRVAIHGQKYSIRKKVFALKKPLVALMLTQNGEANPQIRIFDLDKKEFLGDSIGRVMFNDSRGVSMAWMPDDAGLLYTQAPETNISSQAYFNGKIKLHKIGTDPASDVEIFGRGINDNIELKDYETPYVYSFSNSGYILARIRAGDADNYAFAVHYKDINGRSTPWKRLKNYVNLGDGFDANGKFLYAATSGKPRYEIVRIDMQKGETPELFLPQQKDVIAVTDASNNSGIIAGKSGLYVLMRRLGNMQVLRVDYNSGSASFLPLLQEGSIASMCLLGEEDLVFASGSALRSIQYLRYNLKQNKASILPFAEKFFDASDRFSTRLIKIPSRDGKLIPVSLIYKKDLDLQNNNPLLIDGYGNSGLSTDLFLNPTLFPWLKRGGIYAYAHVRGGGELGDDWIKEGQFPHKMNSINDVVDVADYFVQQQFTSPGKQLVMGGSAGSFLVGMSINQRPDLFAGGIFLAGLPDIVTYRDAAFARESKSVGPIGTKEGFLSSYSISSYYQIPENRALPAMLVVHGATDYILDIYPAARYVAKLQHLQKGSRPMLFLVDWESGHLGGGSELLYLYKFAFWQTGNPEFQPRSAEGR